jgi:hypothetical protein
MLVANACNPNQVGGWDQEYGDTRPAQAIGSGDSIS